MLKRFPLEGDAHRVATLEPRQAETTLFFYPSTESSSHTLCLCMRGMEQTALPPHTHTLAHIHTYTQGRFPCWAFCHAGEVRQHAIPQHCVEYKQGPDSLAE